MVNRGTCDRPLPDQQPVLVRCLCVCCILGILAATWSICLLRRCNRHLRLIVRFAAGHYLANDVMKTCLTLAALYYPVDLEAPKTDHGIVGSNQLLYWLLISSWQNLVSLLLLAILTRYPQIGYDYAILFIVTSWAFAPMPTLGVVTPYYRDGGPSCDRPSLWHPMVTGHNHLIISVPRAILQVVLVVLTILDMTKAPQTSEQRFPSCPHCRMCIMERRIANGIRLTNRLIIGYLIYSLPHAVVLLGLSIVSYPSEGRYDWLLYLIPGACTWVDGLLVLYSQWKLIGRHIIPWEPGSPLGHSDGGDHHSGGAGGQVGLRPSTAHFSSDLRRRRSSMANRSSLHCDCEHCKEHLTPYDEALLRRVMSNTVTSCPTTPAVERKGSQLPETK